MENAFDSLCSALAESEIKDLFLKSEGVDLMVLMMKYIYLTSVFPESILIISPTRDKMQARSRAVKTLDHAMSGHAGAEACKVFVRGIGASNTYSMRLWERSILVASMLNSPSEIMQPLKRQKSPLQVSAPEDTAHTLGILSSLFTNLPSDSPARIRLLAKFVDNNYEKTDKLLDIATSAQTRLVVVDREIDAEKEALLKAAEETGGEEDAWYLRRLDGGLYTLQTVDYILAWIIMEDDGVGAIWLL
jgi:beta-catenin-like protein 1